MSKESTTEKMVAHMNDKYDDHFEFSAPFGGGPGAATKQIIVKSELFPDAQIWVEYYVQDGKDVFVDNYLDYKFEQQTRDVLQELLEDVFDGGVILSYNVGTAVTPNTFSDATTFKEYSSSPESNIGFNAVVSQNQEISDEFIESRILKVLMDSGVIASGSIYFSINESTFKPLSKLNFEERHSMRRFSFGMSSLDSFDFYEWR